MLDWVQNLPLPVNTTELLKFKRRYLPKSKYYEYGIILINYLHFKFWSINLSKHTPTIDNKLSKHTPTIEITIKSICPVPFSRTFVWKIFGKLLSKSVLQRLLLVKFHPFSIIFWAPLEECVWGMKIILWGPSCFIHLNSIESANTSLQKCLMEIIKNESCKS